MQVYHGGASRVVNPVTKPHFFRKSGMWRVVAGLTYGAGATVGAAEEMRLRPAREMLAAFKKAFVCKA